MPGPSLEEGPARQADRSSFRQSIRGAVAILAIHAAGIFVFHAAKRHGEETLETAAVHETSPQPGRPSMTYEGTARTRSSGNESARRLTPSSR